MDGKQKDARRVHLYITAPEVFDAPGTQTLLRQVGVTREGHPVRSVAMLLEDFDEQWRLSSDAHRLVVSSAVWERLLRNGCIVRNAQVPDPSDA
jgi:hypothetical protein